MISLLLDIINFLMWLLGIYLALNCLYLLFFALLALFPLRNKFAESSSKRKTVILFPTYRENVVILDSVRAALVHPYSGNFEVFVIADGLEPETISQLKAMGAGVVEVFFEKSTKGKAMRYAMNELKDKGFEMVLVLDVDNVMGENCIDHMNNALSAGYKVVQAHRTAKNKDTSFAFLDACNEEVNNQIYRKGPVVIGLSASLIGSGIAFDFSYFLHLLQQMDDTVGEDKQLDFMIAHDKQAVAYLDNVYVYDEKIENAEVFTAQRSRWLASQFEFMQKYGLEGIKQLFKGNIEFFNKTLLTFLLPRMLLLAILFLLLVQSLINPIGPNWMFWLALFGSLCFCLLLAIPAKYYMDRRLYKAIWQIPRAILAMFAALMRIGKAKKTFVVTPHKQKPTES